MTPSELERRRLRVTRAKLDQRWGKLGLLLGAGLGLGPREVGVDPDYQANGVWTGVRGTATERIDRNRGTATVVPLLPLPDSLHAWLGYQEVWDLETGRDPYCFRQASLTVHLGEVGDPVKPQLLRLEWPGLRDWDRSGISFQSSGAGHPHWQIDVLESWREGIDAPPFDPNLSENIEVFDSDAVTPTLLDRIMALTIERMHLASSAPWWSNNPPEFGAHHLNIPTDADALSRWLHSAIIYLKQELSRCVVRR